VVKLKLTTNHSNAVAAAVELHSTGSVVAVFGTAEVVVVVAAAAVAVVAWGKMPMS